MINVFAKEKKKVRLTKRHDRIDDVPRDDNSNLFNDNVIVVYLSDANRADVFAERVRPVAATPESGEYRPEPFESDPSIDGMHGRRRSSCVHNYYYYCYVNVFPRPETITSLLIS